MVEHTNIIGLTLEDVAKWPPPNYADPPRQTWMPIYAAIFYAVGTLMVGTRLWLRAAKQAGGLWWDDVLATTILQCVMHGLTVYWQAMMLLAWLGSTMFMVVMILTTGRYKANRAIWNIPFQYYESIAMMVFLLEVAFLFTQACVKISILLLYHRLFHEKSSIAFQIALYVGIIVTAGYSIAYILVISFACLPSEAWWKAFNFTYEANANYSCLDTGTSWINVSCGIFAGGSDLFVIFLPWTMTRSLGLPKRQLFVLNFIFSLGALATAASGFRTYYLYGKHTESTDGILC
nr:hypothetical protein CFP56_52910 [Quercus suber]